MKCWVFDMDGTLIDSHSTYYESLEEVLQSFGSELTDYDKAEILKISVKERIKFFERKLGKNQTAAEALAVLEEKLKVDYLKAVPFAGMMDLVQYLHKQGVHLAVWTAREKPSALAVLKHTGLDQFFSLCMSGSCVAVCKPHPEGLQKIADHFELSPEEIVMVGDHDNDVLAAKAYGAKSVRAYWHNPTSQLDCQIANWKFNQVPEFKKWITDLPLTKTV